MLSLQSGHRESHTLVLCRMLSFFLFYAIRIQAMHKALQSEYVLLLQCPNQL